MTRKKGEPTSTNVYVLAKTFASSCRAPLRAHVTDAPHLKRCLAAGLCEVDGQSLKLTLAGERAIAADPIASKHSTPASRGERIGS